MYIVTDAVCEEVFSRTDAFKAVESVFAAMASGEAYNFPVIREAIGDSDRLSTIFTTSGRLRRLKRWRVLSNSRPLGS
jgi:hypothetical protein